MCNLNDKCTFKKLIKIIFITSLSVVNYESDGTRENEGLRAA